MPVEGYTGLQGSGKTQAMVFSAYKARKQDPDLPVLTNLPVLNLPGRPVEHLTPDMTLDEAMTKLLGFENGWLLLDEIGVYLNSRVWSKMPPELMWKWQQLRKDGIELRWTCIRHSHVVKDIRDITFVTHWMESYKRLGFFSMTDWAYTDVGHKDAYQGRQFMFFRKALLAELYDTKSKVAAFQAVR